MESVSYFFLIVGFRLFGRCFLQDNVKAISAGRQAEGTVLWLVSNRLGLRA